MKYEKLIDDGHQMMATPYITLQVRQVKLEALRRL